MGGVPTKHHSKSKVGRRRSQLALKKQGILMCGKCKAPTVPHRACAVCGFVNKAPRLRPPRRTTDGQARAKKAAA